MQQDIADALARIILLLVILFFVEVIAAGFTIGIFVNTILPW
jgi:hypothetical protein